MRADHRTEVTVDDLENVTTDGRVITISARSETERVEIDIDRTTLERCNDQLRDHDLTAGGIKLTIAIDPDKVRRLGIIRDEWDRVDVKRVEDDPVPFDEVVRRVLIAGIVGCEDEIKQEKERPELDDSDIPF